MSPHPASRSLRRLALALAGAGLLLAALSVTDRHGIGAPTPRADPTFDPLLDAAGGAVCGPVASTQIAKVWLVARSRAKTETAPFQPVPMQAAGGDVPLYANLGTLALPDQHPQPARRRPTSTRACACPSASTMPRRSARSRRRRSSIPIARCASGARRWCSARTSTCR